MTLGSAAQQLAAPFPLVMTRDQAENLITAWNDRLPYIPGEVLVKFRAGTDAATQSRALSAVRGGEVRSRWIGDVLLVDAPSEKDSVALASALERQPEVEWAQANYFRSTLKAPNDPSYNRQWNFDAIDMVRAWDINGGANSSITVAVIDTGVTVINTPIAFTLWTGTRFANVGVPFSTNPDLSTARIGTSADFAFWAGPVLDMVGHGTHVAGTVLEETNNSFGLAGIAYQARLMPLKACLGYWELQILQSTSNIPGFVDPRNDGGCPDSAIAQAIRFAADNGAQIINLSLGGPGASPIELNALQYAVGKGVFVAMAAGNDFLQGNPVEFPAAYAAQIDGAVAVGATGRSNKRAFYSSTGPYVELAAPGGDFRDGGLAGLVYQTSILPEDFDPFSVIEPRFDRYAEVPEEGTSMAAPHVAGVAALLYSQGIKSPRVIEAALKRFAKDLGTTGRDNEFGFGLIDARTTLRGLGLE
jgi:serine protease